MTHRHLAARGLAAALACIPVPALACASCGCTFTADWLAQGLVTQPGQAITIRYDDIPQTVLRTGTDRVGPVDLPADREVEQRTFNHYLTVAYDRQFASDWGIGVSVPVLWRPHRTIDEGETAINRSNTQGLGDIRLTARWQGLSTPRGVTGVQFGLVLPTGGFRQTFRTGPGAGETVDRGLQPGTGTTQAVIGLYHYRRLGSALALVGQAQAQVPLNARQGYRPGTVGEGSLSLQWLGLGSGRIMPQIQLNARISGRDSGEDADPENSGGTMLSVSPGFSARLTSRISAFANVQVPLYQRVNGWQLTPTIIASGGVHLRL